MIRSQRSRHALLKPTLHAVLSKPAMLQHQIRHQQNSGTLDVEAYCFDIYQYVNAHPNRHASVMRM